MAVAALGVVGCGIDSSRDVGGNDTTDAAVHLTHAARLSPLDGLPGIARLLVTDVTAEGELESPSVPREERGEAASIEETPVYAHPPLHDSIGSTYSDVGMPYPLPDVPTVTPEVPVTPSEPAPEPAPFFETSFAGAPPATATSEFPGTSFGPPPPASSAFPETTFGPPVRASTEFPETTLGLPAPASSAFPETTFGPPVPASSEFPETTFGSPAPASSAFPETSLP